MHGFSWKTEDAAIVSWLVCIVLGLQFYFKKALWGVIKALLQLIDGFAFGSVKGSKQKKYTVITLLSVPMSGLGQRAPVFIFSPLSCL